ncbi:AhpD-like protein [Xylariales sp. PMI_506]|nr:AhpD-like protein [Xylariales sp. PMI_506]
MRMAAPMLAPVITPALLSTLRHYPNLPHHTWYLIAATTLTILNRPDEIRKVYTYAIEKECRGAELKSSMEEELRISRRMREALVKTSAIGGLPKTINSLLSLKEVTPVDMLDEVGSASPTGRSVDLYQIPTYDILRRGQTFFDMIYGKISKRVMGQMDRSGTEDLGLIGRLVYGHILSNVKILSPAETSFIMIAGLIPQDVNPQLKGHLRGALNGGATVEEVRAVRQVAMMICEAYGMKRLAEQTAGGWGWTSDVANV